jgi:hypothetical protein
MSLVELVVPNQITLQPFCDIVCGLPHMLRLSCANKTSISKAAREIASDNRSPLLAAMRPVIVPNITALMMRKSVMHALRRTPYTRGNGSSTGNVSMTRSETFACGIGSGSPPQWQLFDFQWLARPETGSAFPQFVHVSRA